ncbi:MAG: type I-U CRISPR-associated protein Cas5/Cas6 [Candidatus Wallbacteria bacterium]|nr:type I-U CRISPR-associated protein Cas5/Cas6 [Candidatus Wallbacteria bacterium]
MPTLLLRFPGGRYHATPYGHHVNEGLVEWPPSPWRLLRALLACGHATQKWSPKEGKGGVPSAASKLIEALATTLPRYRLPAASLAHSRHYMPLDGSGQKKTLVFDTWAHVGEGTLAVRWDCPLDEDSERLFHSLAENLGYLGRSESWVLAKAISDDHMLPLGVDSFPHDGDRPPGPGWEQVSLLAPESRDAYEAWRKQSIQQGLSALPESDGKRGVSKKLQKKRQEVQLPFPQDLLDCLQKDTSWWKGHHWSQPPGSRRVLYWRPDDALAVGPPARVAAVRPRPVAAMLLALTTRSGSLSALPSVTRTLPQAELIHRALIGRAGEGEPIDCPELVGRDGSGQPLKGHQHAHVLPLDLDVDGHLDHVLVYAPMGLGPRAQQAIRMLHRTWAKGSPRELRLALVGEGGLDDLMHLPPPLHEGVRMLLAPSRIWRSKTPLVLPRHCKRRGANRLEGQLLAELESHGLPPASVEVMPWNDETSKLRFFARVRRHPAPPPPVDAGFAVQLQFDEPTAGPIVLGYGSHFGLGLFAAAPK